MKELIDKVRDIVKNEAEESDWKYHIIPVVNYSKELAKMLNADEVMAELSALLHDIGRLKFGGKDHEVTGVKESENILKSLNAEQSIIDEVKHCIESHRSSKAVQPKTVIAKIVANADALSHFDILPVFFFWRSKEGSFEEVFKWVDEKIERDWKKLTLPEAQKMAKEKYDAIKVVLDANRQYLCG